MSSPGTFKQTAAIEVGRGPSDSVLQSRHAPARNPIGKVLLGQLELLGERTAQIGDRVRFSVVCEREERSHQGLKIRNCHCSRTLTATPVDRGEQ